MMGGIASSGKMHGNALVVVGKEVVWIERMGEPGEGTNRSISRCISDADMG